MLNHIWINIKIMFRIPLAIFFSIVYPVVMMIAILTSYGNIPIGNGLHLIDKYFLIAIGMGIMPLTLISFPMWIGNSYENNSLLRLIYFNVNIKKIVISDIIAHLLIGLLGVTINILFAYFVYELNIAQFKYFLVFLFQTLLCIFVFMLIGSVIGFTFKDPQILLPFGLVLMFIIYILCGVFTNFQELPIKFQRVAEYIPLKYVMNDFFSIWTGETMWNIKYLKLSFVYIIICLLLLFILTGKLRKLNNSNF